MGYYTEFTLEYNLPEETDKTDKGGKWQRVEAQVTYAPFNEKLLTQAGVSPKQ